VKQSRAPSRMGLEKNQGKDQEDRQPNPAESVGHFAVLDDQARGCRGKRLITLSGQIGQKTCGDLNPDQAPLHPPYPIRQKTNFNQSEKKQMQQWKQNGQRQWNMCSSAVMKMFHLNLSVGPLRNWRQHLLAPAALMFSLSAAAKPPSKASDEDGRTKVLMHSLVLEFAKMNPYLASDKAFSSEKGREVVGESLKILAGKVKSPPAALKKSTGFRITYNLLADHIEKTNDVFTRGEMEYARMKVNGIGNLCAACHMQAPKISNYSAFEFIAERGKEATFENAEFLFVIRRYDESLALFDRLVRAYPSKNLASDQLSEVYRRKLAIFARVYRDPIVATTNLKEDLKNGNLPMDIRREIEAWISTLDKWKLEKSDPAKMKTPELLAFVRKNLPATVGRKITPSHPELLSVLRLSGLLYERLYQEPDSPQTQELLYSLAQFERALSPLYWYSLNEIYLKECIVQFPKREFSKKCFEAYREGMQERYFGRTLPDGVKRSLDALKAYL
jgi:tetratricopeptide (TPR) repeat protein